MNMKGKEIMLSVAQVALIAFVSMGSGKAGARIIMSLAREYIKKRKKPCMHAQLTDGQFREACARLERDGLITKESRGIWRVAQKGKEKARTLMAGIDRRESYPTSHNDSLRTIVIFDVPEKQREKRALIRAELAALEFKPLQKSVWIGSAPIPKKCMEYFRDIEVIPHIHVFSINRPGTIS